MENSISNMKSDALKGVVESARTKAPILWALLALAYLFEIGAVTVIINTGKYIQEFAGYAAMGFPIFAMIGIIAIRARWEHLFYVSHEHAIGLEKLRITKQ